MKKESIFEFPKIDQGKVKKEGIKLRTSGKEIARQKFMVVQVRDTNSGGVVVESCYKVVSKNYDEPVHAFDGFLAGVDPDWFIVVPYWADMRK